MLLTLGSHVPAVLAPLSPELEAWRGRTSVAQLDALGVPLVRGVTFEAVPGPRTTVVVALTHPSLRGPNVRRRRYAELAGDAAEVAMLGDALRASGP